MHTKDKEKPGNPEPPREYRKPELRQFGTIRQTTQTDPALSGGEDFVSGLDLWGDPT